MSSFQVGNRCVFAYACQLSCLDRTTPSGQMINSYLTGQVQQDDHSIHLLFSANRWEAVKGILESINDGVTVIVDRYSFSGAVYSAAKDNPNLTLDWAWYPEIGLPQPDLVYFLDISSAEAAKRGGYGEERYETEKMQTRVKSLFTQLFTRLPGVNVQIIDAGRSLDDVSHDIITTFDEAAASVDSSSPLSSLSLLAA
jgi:dTMP kinase